MMGKVVACVATTFASLLVSFMTTMLLGLVFNNQSEYMPKSYQVFMWCLFGVLSLIGILFVAEQD